MGNKSGQWLIALEALAPTVIPQPVQVCTITGALSGRRNVRPGMEHEWQFLRRWPKWSCASHAASYRKQDNLK